MHRDGDAVEREVSSTKPEATAGANEVSAVSCEEHAGDAEALAVSGYEDSLVAEAGTWTSDDLASARKELRANSEELAVSKEELGADHFCHALRAAPAGLLWRLADPPRGGGNLGVPFQAMVRPKWRAFRSSEGVLLDES